MALASAIWTRKHNTRFNYIQKKHHNTKAVAEFCAKFGRFKGTTTRVDFVEKLQNDFFAMFGPFTTRVHFAVKRTRARELTL